jgi:hypothetical protein
LTAAPGATGISTTTPCIGAITSLPAAAADFFAPPPFLGAGFAPFVTAPPRGTGRSTKRTRNSRSLTSTRIVSS